ncbi:MAG: hypothetical protein U9R43_18750 [Thermodesulfobacteriota bacterium]|nr:hypothetical protein [Thermodesulfobacteriota bacterium]
MNISKKKKLLTAQLNENFEALEKSLDVLNYSFRKCKSFGEKEEYEQEEQESFEALTSRFARTSDILTQKVFKSLFALLQENVNTIIDSANILEKLGIVENADDVLNIRELRNQIAHEYVEADLNALFMDVLRYVPAIETVVNNLKKYIDNQFLSKS